MITKKSVARPGLQKHRKRLDRDLYHDISRATYEVCFLDADSHTPLYVRALQTQWSQPYVNPCFSTSCAHSVGFTAEIHHVSCSSKKYSIEIDGLLASGRGSQTGRRACYFSAFHRLEKSHKAPDENSDSPQLVPYPTKITYHDSIYLFDLELAQTIGKNIFQIGTWCAIHIENIPPECWARMDTFNGRVLKKKENATGSNRRQSKDSFSCIRMSHGNASTRHLAL